MGQLDIFTKRLYNKNHAVQVPNSIFTKLFVQVSMVTSLILKVELLNSQKKKITYDLLGELICFPTPTGSMMGPVYITHMNGSSIW